MIIETLKLQIQFYCELSNLVLHELGPVIPLLPRRLLEELGEAMEGDVVTLKVAAHGQVDVGSLQLHADVHVDAGLKSNDGIGDKYLNIINLN